MSNHSVKKIKPSSFCIYRLHTAGWMLETSFMTTSHLPLLPPLLYPPLPSICPSIFITGEPPHLSDLLISLMKLERYQVQVLVTKCHVINQNPVTQTNNCLLFLMFLQFRLDSAGQAFHSPWPGSGLGSGMGCGGSFKKALQMGSCTQPPIGQAVCWTSL